MTTTTAYLDPFKGAKIPLKLGAGLLDQEFPRKRQKISLSYNHWPKGVIPGQATIKARDGQTCTMEVREAGSGNHEYKGAQRPSRSGQFGLFYNSTDKTMTLDRIDVDLVFNLREPRNDKRHPQLETSDAELNVSDEDADSAVPADPSNPYDYRHFLNREQSPSSDLATSPPPSSLPDRHETSPTPEPEAAPQADDPDELVVDMGDEPVNARPWRSALKVLNDAGDGPISLRSAASSMSPSIRGEEEEGNNGWDDADDELEAEFNQALENSHDRDETEAESGHVETAKESHVEPSRESRAVAESSSESEEE